MLSSLILTLMGCAGETNSAVEPLSGVEEPSATLEAELFLVTNNNDWFGGPEPAPRPFDLGADSKGCVYFEADNVRFTPVWPSGYTALGDVDAFRILDRSGDPVLSSEESINATGIEYENKPEIHLNGLECGTAPYFWITGL